MSLVLSCDYPAHHVWVAQPGDGRRLYRSTVFCTPGLIRLAIVSGVCLALLIISVVLDPSHNPTWLFIGVLFPALFVVLLIRRSKVQEAMVAPGSVWATGFGANEL